MNFLFECGRIVLAILCSFSIGIYAHIVLSLWQTFPIEEERSTPIYITKELFNDD